MSNRAPEGPPAAPACRRRGRYRERRGLLGPPVQQWSRLELPVAEVMRERVLGEVLYVDHFGNLITNIPASAVSSARSHRDPRCLSPHNLLCDGSQQHFFLHFHDPLRLGARVRSAGFQLPASRPSSGFFKADNSCVNSSGQLTY